jgi:hypothetical protein
MAPPFRCGKLVEILRKKQETGRFPIKTGMAMRAPPKIIETNHRLR